MPRGAGKSSGLAIIAMIVLGSSVPLFGQDASGSTTTDASTSASAAGTSDSGSNVDNLFTNPAGDTTTKDSGTDYRATFESAPATKLSGTLTGQFGFGAGWTDYPSFSDLKHDYVTTVGFLGSTTASFDARPDPSFHATGTVSLSYDPRSAGVYTWNFNSIAITELYGDYNLKDFVYFRFGQYGMSWGQGRLFMPGNLVSDAGNGFALRISLPTILSGLSFVTLAQPAFFTYPQNPSWRELAVGGTADMVIQGLRIGLGGRFQKKSGAEGLLSLKTTILGTDLLFDGVGSETTNGMVYESLTGFFHEWNELKVYGEWFWNGTGKAVSSWSNTTDAGVSAITAGGTIGHSIGLVFALKNMFGSGVSAATEWLHSFSDGSGAIIAGLKYSPWDHITLQIASVPFSYGPTNGYYVANNIDPGNRKVGVVLLATVSDSF